MFSLAHFMSYPLFTITTGGSMSIGKRQEVKAGGRPLGYIEYVALGGLWRAVPFGVALYLPPMFGMKGYALEFVRKYGRAK